MEKTRFARIADLFARAVSLDREEQRSLLGEECGDDDDLKHEVLALLERERRPGRLRTGLGHEMAGEIDTPPERIGPYELREKIGEGGMGVVYHAEQLDPIRRSVALKLVRRSIATERVVGRFENERQTLALMEHPNIARVFDAGTTDQGQPYFVMELIRGESLAEYCDRLELGVDERLNLFRLVCDAVQHAHQRAIIHRDLKPSNILVAEDGIPKVIDFGVAKALDASSSVTSGQTAEWHLVGTPGYMSPEQALLGASRVDTRSDVYALGVILYELLTGSIPLGEALAGDTSYFDLCKRLADAEPPAPSRVVETARTDTVKCGSNPAALARRVRGDLDCIVLKALQRDPDHRYGSARELADDLERHLRHEAIRARPHTAAYRLRKFARKNRAAVFFSTLLLGSVVGFAVISSIQSMRIAAESRRATEATEFLLGFLGTPRTVINRLAPQVNRRSREVLETAVQRVRTDLESRPELQVRLLLSIADIFETDRLGESAIAIAEEAHAIAVKQLGETNPLTLQTAEHLGDLLYRVRDFERGERLLADSLQQREKSGSASDPEVVRVRVNLAALYKDWGRPERTVTILEGVLAETDSTIDMRDRAVLSAKDLLSASYLEVGRYAEALPMLEDLRATLPSAYGEEAPGYQIVPYNLACALANLGRTSEALDSLTEAVENGFNFFGNLYADPMLEPLNGRPDFDALTRTAILNGFAYGSPPGYAIHGRLAREDHDRTETALRAMIEAIGRTRGDGLHRNTHRYRNLLARLQLRTGKYHEAIRTSETIRAVIRHNPGIRPGFLAETLWYESQANLGLGRPDEALDLFERAIFTGGSERLINWRYYHEAMVHSLDGDRAEALTALRASARTGFYDYEWIRDDLAFRELHGDPEFEEVLAAVDANLP